MNTLKNIVVAAIVLCFGFYHASAQDEDQEVSKLQFTPPTPEVAALGKYIETPVSLFTGIPQISIPIYNIQQKRFSIPISLSYHAGGIKVEEVASRVGMGWTLSAGGMITRTMKKQPDDASSGYLNTPYTVSNINDYLPLESSEGQQLLQGLLANTLDYQPDIFNFSFAGYSGSFYFDQETKLPIFQDYVPLKVEPVYKRSNQTITNSHPGLDSRDHNTVILSFIITTPEGIQYHFGKAKDTDDYATQIRGSSEIDVRYIGLPNAAGPVGDFSPNERAYISTWYLKEIYDPISEQSVYYNYITEDPILLTRTSEEHVIYEELPGEGRLDPAGACALSFPPDDQLRKHFLSSSAKEYLINEIIFDQGKIEFINDTEDRLDLPLSKALSEIVVKDNHDKLIKSYGLTQFYTTSSRYGYEFPLNDFFPIAYSTGFKRLFLENIREYEINSDNNTVNQSNFKTFGFEYNSPEELPHRFAAMQDYWGFYNEAYGNRNLMPDQVYIYTAPDGRRITKNIGEADRSVSTEGSKYGTLSKITYPTGGSKTFVYENNMTFNTVESNPYEWVHHYFDYRDVSAQTTLPDPDYLEYEWTIDIDIAQIIDFNINAPCNSSEDEFDTCPWLINFKSISASNSTDFIWTHTKTVSRYLQPGTYKIKVTYGEYNNGPPDFGPNGDIFELNFRTLQYVVPVEEIELTPSGGLRIKEIITDDDGDNDIENRRFEYVMEDGSPSGFFAGQKPYYQDQITEIRCLDKEANPIPQVVRINKANLRSYRSVSTIPLTQTSGSYFGNRRITEYIGNQEIGKTIHEFTMASDRFAIFPEAHIENYSYLRGKPLSTTIFRNDNGNFIEEQRTVYNYTTVDRSSQKAYSFFANSYEDLLDFDNNGSLDNIITFHGEYTEYNLKSRWYKLDNIIKATYDPETNESMKDSTVYRYNNNTLNQTRISKYISSYSNTFAYQTVDNYYPDDIDALSSFNIPDEQRPLIETLNRTNQNRISELVLTENKGWGSLESKKTIRFKEYSNNRVLPEYAEIYKEGYGTFITGKVLQYDDDLNPIEVQEKENSPITSYIWGYQGQYPIAVLKNIAYNDIPENTITTLKNLSNADNDRCTENICAEQELREALKTLRNNFPNGMVTTFTYDTLIGTTSTTDPKGYTSYYVYDGYNRLQYIKDAEGNVLQEYEYNYKNQ
ncbi:hypothetical protein [uncultured Aquimarina sp.]|uniref:hypothetical protein n=1 Tax=uncultured Aquimarina sp. TaxID=575652 RepID=UPI0026121C36|nr:hypothetical protein [uncultured Aquimarina sp.]